MDNDQLLSLIDTPPPAERQTAVDDDGWIYDLQTGEVVGRTDADEAFQVNNDDTANWVLRLKSEIEGQIVGLDARIEALLGELKALRAEQVRRLGFIQYRYEPSLIVFARSRLKGKERTARFTWGHVSFRVTPATSELLDEDAAVAWMKLWKPEKIRVWESVTKSDVLRVRDELAREFGEEPEHLSWLKFNDPGENVTVSTGMPNSGKTRSKKHQEDE